MNRLETVRAEIDALLEELNSLEKERANAPSKDSSTDASAPLAGMADKMGEAIAALGQLRDQLSETASEAGDLVEDHPYAATASAFLLGLVVGRISKRF